MGNSSTVRRRLAMTAAAFLLLLTGLLVAPGPALASSAKSAIAATETSGETAMVEYVKCQENGPGVWFTLCVSFEDYFDPDVFRMTTTVHGSSPYGHWEFFGPHGHIADSGNAYFSTGQGFGWNQFMTGGWGDRWCARFWELRNGSYVQITPNICVTR
ncbi:hypothetical protein [Streptosporangium roseum]|uniref:hypothetical protein n=1 Tax=Streptosporangium roseum TaxID=2001 RepID=UPI0033285471